MDINVDFAALDAGQEACKRAATNLQTKLDDLKHGLTPLTSTWSGKAAEEYKVHQANWDAAALKLQNILHSVGVALGAAQESYRANENKAAGSWV